MRLKDIQILTGHLGPIYTCHFMHFLWSDSYFCIIYIPTASDFRSGGNKMAALRQGPCEDMMSDEIKIFNRIQEKVCYSEAVLFVWSRGESNREVSCCESCLERYTQRQMHQANNSFYHEGPPSRTWQLWNGKPTQTHTKSTKTITHYDMHFQLTHNTGYCKKASAKKQMQMET